MKWKLGLSSVLRELLLKDLSWTALASLVKGGHSGMRIVEGALKGSFVTAQPQALPPKG